MAKPKIANNVKIPAEILEELLTPSEIRMLKNRWQILKLLENGLSMRQVAGQVKVGTDTVVRVARMTDKNSLRKLVDKTFRLRSRSSTPWIFGQSE